MKSILTLALALFFAFCSAACRKRSTPSSPPAADVAPAPAQPTDTSPATPAPVAVPKPAPAPFQGGNSSASQFNYVQGSSALDDLNKHLAWFVISKKRYPANVDELLAANRLPRPVLPPGGQLVINQKSKSVEYVGPK